MPFFIVNISSNQLKLSTNLHIYFRPAWIFHTLKFYLLFTLVVRVCGLTHPNKTILSECGHRTVIKVLLYHLNMTHLSSAACTEKNCDSFQWRKHAKQSILIVQPNKNCNTQDAETVQKYEVFKLTNFC